MAIQTYLQLMLVICAAFIASVYAQLDIQLPGLTGSHTVGTIALELQSSTNPRDLMVSFFYPTPKSSSQYPLAPAFPPQSAAFLSLQSGLPPGLNVNVTTQAHLNAPISSKDFPTLVFTTGYGTSRLEYTATAENLASQGYIVALVDHPLDVAFIEYPDGRFIVGDPIGYNTTDEYIPTVNARVQDVTTVLDSLSNKTFISQIPGVTSRGGLHRFQTSSVGILGHSLGGASAAAAILADKRFVAGVNLDGAIIGNVTMLGISKPFLIMSAEGHDRTNDPTWAEFWTHLTGYKREIQVSGTRHGSYSDLLILADELIALGVPIPDDVTQILGTIAGIRMLEIESAYIDAFFRKWLNGGTGRLLDRPNKLFPEVTFQA